MAEPTIEHCTCKNEYQDTKYGKQQRVHNPTAKGGRRCTVCNNTKGEAKK